MENKIDLKTWVKSGRAFPLAAFRICYTGIIFIDFITFIVPTELF